MHISRLLSRPNNYHLHSSNPSGCSGNVLWHRSPHILPYPRSLPHPPNCQSRRAIPEPSHESRGASRWHEDRHGPPAADPTGHTETERYWHVSREAARDGPACPRSEHEEPSTYNTMCESSMGRGLTDISQIKTAHKMNRVERKL
jgi:hypothetical protein